MLAVVSGLKCGYGLCAVNGDGTQVLKGPFEVQPVVESEGKQVFRAKRRKLDTLYLVI